MQLRTLGLTSESRIWLLAFFLAILCLAKVRAMNDLDMFEMMAKQSRGSGLLKMCPPGGEAFTTSWQLACGMKRRKRSADQVEIKAKRAAYRPLSMTEMMTFCCQYGCSFRDLLPYCDPFGQWDS